LARFFAPRSAKASLSWIGFSEDFILTVMDSQGYVSGLFEASGWQWVPLLDTVPLKKARNDVFWPVSCIGGKFVCVPLRGGNEHPEVLRRPITTVLSYRMPIARAGAMAKNAVQEEMYLRTKLALKQKNFMIDFAPEDLVSTLESKYSIATLQLDKITAALFKDCLDKQRVHLGLDVCKRFLNESYLDLVLKMVDTCNWSSQALKSEFCEKVSERASLLEDEHTRDEVREMAADIMATQHF